MITRFPIAGIIGLVSAVGATGFWIAEQLSGQMLFEVITIPFKLALLAALLFFLSDLSRFLHGRPSLAVGMALTLIVITTCAALAYLPWRESFARHFNNDGYKWFYVGMAPSPFYPGFDEWRRGWNRSIPHLIELGLTIFYYGGLIAACSFRRFGRVGGFLVGMGAYAVLLIIPMITGLIVWDYDTFLCGIVFDSISMDLFPPCFWYAGDFSIFLYVFMLIFYGVCAVFFCARPQSGLIAPTVVPLPRSVVTARQ